MTNIKFQIIVKDFKIEKCNKKMEISFDTFGTLGTFVTSNI